MAIPAFDTYVAAKTLRAGGFDRSQAAAAVAVIRNAVAESSATKAAQDRLRAEMAIEAGYDRLRADMVCGFLVLAAIALIGFGTVVALLLQRLP